MIVRDDDSDIELLPPDCSVMQEWAHLRNSENLTMYDFGQDIDWISAIDMSTPRISEVDERISSMFALKSTHRINNMPQWAHSFRELIEGSQLNLSAMLQSVMSDLRNCIPERYNGEFDRDIIRLQNSSKDEVFVSFLGYAVYLCTNNLIREDQVNGILQWVINDEHFSTLVTFLDNKTVSTEAFSYQLFRAALAQCNITQCNIKAVKSLLATGISLKRFMYSCATEFYVAVQRDDISLVSLLLKHGMDANMPVEKIGLGSLYVYPFTILEAATSVEMIKLLINGGAIVDLQAFHTLKVRPHPRATPLQIASAAGRTDLVGVLIEAGANVNYPPIIPDYDSYPHGVTALMAAVEGAHFETSRLLLQNGADPNQYSNFKGGRAFRFPKIPAEISELKRLYTESYPLHAAAGNGDLELVRLLIDYGADLNALNCWRHSSESPQFWNSFLHNPSGSPGLFLTPLVQAIENRHLDVVKFLSQAGADVNQNVLGIFGTKAINAARDKPECLQVLIESGAVEYSDSDFDEIDLKLAVWRGDLELVYNLLALGFNANMSGFIPSDGTILHIAVAEQDVLLINALLDNGADVNGKSDPRTLPKVTPLQVAVFLADFDSARLLCEAGADVNATGEYKQSPLQLSLSDLCYKNGPEKEKLVQIVDLLLSNGAQINVANQSYNSPLIMAIKTVECIGSLHLVLKLLELGASVNDYGSSGTETALEVAVNFSDPSDDFKVVRMILDWKTDVNHRASKYRGTALQSAVRKAAKGRYTHKELAMSKEEHEKQCIKLVELLLDLGADINAAPAKRYGRTALQAAVEGSQNLELIDLLLSKGAKINAPPAAFHGRTVLQAATSEAICSINLIQKLLDAGADVNCPPCPDGGVTALQGAAIQGHLTIAKLLIKNGAKVNAPASKEDGITALEGASVWGRLDMVQLLLNAGADLHLPPEERYKSSIEYANREYHIAIANLLSSRRRDMLEQMSG